MMARMGVALVKLPIEDHIRYGQICLETGQLFDSIVEYLPVATTHKYLNCVILEGYKRYGYGIEHAQGMNMTKSQRGET